MYPIDERNKVRRLPERGAYDRDSIYPVLDEGLLAHVGFAANGQPTVIPMTYARDGDDLILHGSVASRLLKIGSEGVPMSVCVTFLDGLVLARSTFNHSMNYRSVVAFGNARVVDEPAEKMAALDLLVEHLIPGRTGNARASNRKELGATTVLRMPIEQASLKQRSGPPGDNPADMSLGHWAGVIPMTTQFGTAIADEPCMDMPIPDHVSQYQR
ncbi:MAG: flavin-nucleotide-binding protein [Lysobacteraceae bacterium]|nr:MAG: flavin-nucleotide-binding protein [Xanthomonadaceae bacterium]